MTSPVSALPSNAQNLWSHAQFSSRFGVIWTHVKDVPNAALRHVRIPDNDHRPVTTSRDAQEIMERQGLRVLYILHNYAHESDVLEGTPEGAVTMVEVTPMPLMTPSTAEGGTFNDGGMAESVPCQTDWSEFAPNIYDPSILSGNEVGSVRDGASIPRIEKPDKRPTLRRCVSEPSLSHLKRNVSSLSQVC